MEEIKVVQVATLDYIPKELLVKGIQNNQSHINIILFDLDYKTNEIIEIYNVYGDDEIQNKTNCDNIIQLGDIDGIISKVHLLRYATGEKRYIKRYYALFKDENHSILKPTILESIDYYNGDPKLVTVELCFSRDGYTRYITKKFKTGNMGVWTFIERLLDDDFRENLNLEYEELEECYYMVGFDDVFEPIHMIFESETQIQNALVSYRTIGISDIDN